MTSVKKNCEACGILITVRLADHKRGWGRFCGKACAAGYKCGMRPRDVNKRHAKEGGIWAVTAFAAREAAGVTEWLKAPSIQAQIGHKVKVKPTHHSPPTRRECRECGIIQTNGIYCFDCEVHLEGMDASEAGWDGHKEGAA